MACVVGEYPTAMVWRSANCTAAQKQCKISRSDSGFSRTGKEGAQWPTAIILLSLHRSQDCCEPGMFSCIAWHACPAVQFQQHFRAHLPSGLYIGSAQMLRQPAGTLLLMDFVMTCHVSTTVMHPDHREAASPMGSALLRVHHGARLHTAILTQPASEQVTPA